MVKRDSCGVLEDVEPGKKVSLRAQWRIGIHILQLTVWLQ